MGQIMDLVSGETGVYRDYNTDNVPSSGNYEPVKLTIRELFEVVEALAAKDEVKNEKNQTLDG